MGPLSEFGDMTVFRVGWRLLELEDGNGTPRRRGSRPLGEEADVNQPVMDHWTTVKRIHQSALDVDPSERAALVDELCGGDEALRFDCHPRLSGGPDPSHLAGLQGVLSATERPAT